MRKGVFIVASVFILCVIAAPAALADGLTLTLNSGVTPNTTTFTISGTFGSTVPTTMISAPGDTYSFSFTLATSPVLTACAPCGTAPFPGQFDAADGIFQLDTVNTTFTLGNGTPTVFSTDFLVQFDTLTGGMNPNPGGLLICFDDGSSCDTDWTIVGQQLFTGSVANPTFLNAPGGVSVSAASGFDINGQSFPFGPSGPAATPEPSSIFLLGTGLLGLGFAVRRKLRLT